MMERVLNHVTKAALVAIVALAALLGPARPAAAAIEGLTLDPQGTVQMPGGASVTVSGTFQATVKDTVYFIEVQIAQNGGRFGTWGWGFDYVNVPATGSPQTWQMNVLSLEGFHPGNANVIVTMYTFGPGGSDQIQIGGTVHLSAE